MPSGTRRVRWNEIVTYCPEGPFTVISSFASLKLAEDVREHVRSDVVVVSVRIMIEQWEASRFAKH